MKLSWLPSKFAARNFTLATLIPLLSVAILYVLNTDFVYVYVCGAVTFYASIKLYHYRVRRHEYLNPPSYAEFVYDMTTGLDKLQSDFNTFTLNYNFQKIATAGG